MQRFGNVVDNVRTGPEQRFLFDKTLNLNW